MDGRPIAGVVLRVAGDEALGDCARAATSDAKGQWSLDGLRAGGRTELRLTEPAGWLAPSATVMASQAAPSLDLRLHPAADPEILVTDASGAPMAGARVRLPTDLARISLVPPLGEDRRDAIQSFGKDTLAEGRASLPRLPSAIPWRVAVTHPDRAPASVTASGRALADLRLRLTPGGSVRLRTLDSSGAPLAGIGADPLAGPDADLVSDARASGADGVLVVTHLPAGRWDLRVNGPGVRPQLLRGIDVAEGAVTEAGDVLLEPGADIEGVVRSDSGPVDGARVRAWTKAEGESVKLEAETDAAGRFVFEGLDPREPADVEASSDRHLPQRKDEVLPGGDVVELVLEPSASLIVLARDARSSDPVTGASVEAGPEMRSRSFEAVPGEAPGEVLVTGLPEGSASVIVRAPGYISETRRDIAVRAGEPARLEVDLAEGTSVEGVVVERESGRPVAFATLTVEAQGSHAVADAEGRFVLDGLRAPFDVVANADTHLSARVLAVDPALLPESGLRIELDRGGGVEGVVYGPDGAPLPGARVSADEGARSSISDANGRHRIEGLAEGPQRITKTDRPGSWDGWEEVVVEIRRGALARADFGGGLRIVGSVTHQGEPARGAQVSAMRADGGGMPTDSDKGLATTDADGRYVLGIAEPGTFGLMVQWRGIAFGKQVTVPPDVPEVVADLVVPDDHLSGRVVDDATGDPIEGASLNLMTHATGSGNSMSTMMSGHGEDGERQSARWDSRPTSRATSDADGRFRVLATERGPAGMWVWREGYEVWQSPEGFEVTGSRSDLEIRMKQDGEGDTGKLVVSLVSDVTGEPLSGTIIIETRKADAGAQGGNTSVNSGSSRATGSAPAEGEVAQVIGWSSGRAIGHRAGILPTDEDIEVQLRLVPKGSLRVLLTPGVITRDSFVGWQGEMKLRLPSGLVLEPANVNLQANVTSKIAREEASGEWLFDDLPPGPVSVSVGGGEWETVDVIAGAIAEIDMR